MSFQTAVPTAPDLGARRLHPIALATVLTAVTVPIMSFFTVNVALGEIGRDLGATPALLQLVVAAYGVVYASSVVIGGRLGDGYGRKRMLVAGLVLFAATSLLCSIAQGPVQLVAARFVQGLSAALIAPQVLAIITAGTSGRYRARAMAWFGASAGLATSLAFLVGGALTGSDLGWRSVFWINVPVTALIIVGVLRFVPETKAPTPTPLDLVGAGLLALMLILLVLPLTEGRAIGWPAWTWISLVAVAPVAVALGWWQRRLEQRGGTPLVSPSLFRLRSVSVGLIVSAPFYVVFGGFIFVYAYAGQAAELTPIGIGLRLIPMALGFLTGSIVAGRLVGRHGIQVLTVGGAMAAVGFVLVSQVAVDGAYVPATVLGLGIGLVWSPLMGVVLSQVPAHLAGLGSGLLITTMQAGLGLGAAVVGSVYLGFSEPTGSGYARTVLILAAVMLVVAALTRLLPGRRESDAVTVRG